MIFKEFNRIVNLKEAGHMNVDEKLLFTSLAEAFKGNIFSDVIHGSKGMVEFEFTSPTSKQNTSCEIGDLLIVVFNSDEIRYTLMQNKTMHKKIYFGTDPIRIPVRQHYLLSEKPIISKGATGYPFFRPDILSSALLDSVGSFGVFYKWKSLSSPEKYYYDMNYMIANRLSFGSPASDSQCTNNRARKANFKGEINNIVSKSNKEEIEACANLRTLEYAMKKMLIGTPIQKNKFEEHPEIFKLLFVKVTDSTSQYDYIEEQIVKANFLRIIPGQFKDLEDDEIQKYLDIETPTIILVDSLQINTNEYNDI